MTICLILGMLQLMRNYSLEKNLPIFSDKTGKQVPAQKLAKSTRLNTPSISCQCLAFIFSIRRTSKLKRFQKYPWMQEQVFLNFAVKLATLISLIRNHWLSMLILNGTNMASIIIWLVSASIYVRWASSLFMWNIHI